MLSDSQHSLAVELHDLSKMDRIRNAFKAKPAYAPVNAEAQDEDTESYNGSDEAFVPEEESFSWIEYSIFMLLGVAMLWAWYDCSKKVL